MTETRHDADQELVRVSLDGAVATIELTRPPVNAICAAMHDQLISAAAHVQSSGARAVVLRGSQKSFAAGADIAEMAGLDAAGIAAFAERLGAAVDAIAAIEVPVIAAITGYALGGGLELALAADFRVVGASARLGLPEVTLGVIPGAGGTQRLSRLIGPSAAKDLIFSGRSLRGEEAVAAGLANRAVDDGEVFPVATDWAKKLAAGATVALAAAKRAVDEGLPLALADGLRLERDLFVGLFGTEDQRHGMESFLADGPGKATFRGR